MTLANEVEQTELRRKALEAIHDSAVDAIITINDAGIIETVNPSTESMFGYSVSELVGNNVNLLMPAPQQSEHNTYLANYLKSRVPKIIGIGREVLAKRKDGSTFPIHLAVSEIELEGRRVFVGFVRDLTDLKMVQAQRAVLGQIIEESLNEVYVFDAESLRFIQINRGARENLGYSLDELRQLTPVDLKPEFTRAEFEQSFLEPLLRKKVDRINFNTVHRRKDGSTYDVEVHLQLATYERKPAFVAIILDVTQKLQAERMVRQQQQDLKAELERQVELRTSELRKAQSELVQHEKFSTLGKVSGGIAHEIRNPLNAVKTSAYFLLNAKSPSNEKIEEHLKRIDRQVSLIDDVITALSDIAKLPEAILRPVAMVPILRDVVDSINLPASVQVVFDFQEPVPKVLADETQIGIGFRNLVQNAREAMPQGGTIMLAAEIGPEFIVFSVVDNGVGISAEDLEKILEPMFTTKARGMGLGLSITRAIVEKNRGKLTMESTPGRGSKVNVALMREK